MHVWCTLAGNFRVRNRASSATGGEDKTIQESGSRYRNACGECGALFCGLREKHNGVLTKITRRFGKCRKTDFHRSDMATDQKSDEFIEGLLINAVYKYYRHILVLFLSRKLNLCNRCKIMSGDDPSPLKRNVYIII